MMERLRTFTSLRALRRRAVAAHGFTMFELLTTISLIGVVAAIGIPTFRSQQARSDDADAQEQVRVLSRALESCYVDEQSYSTCATVSVLRRYAGQAGTKNGVTGLFDTSGGMAATINGAPAVTRTTYSVSASSSSGNTFTIARATSGGVSRVTRSCTSTGSAQGGCSGGTWGG